MPQYLLLPAGVSFAANDDTDEEKVFSEIQVARTGSWDHPWYGEFEITPSMLREMQRNFRVGARDLVVDYQHGSLATDPEAGKAAGWVDTVYGLKVKNSGDELWARVAWTIQAVEYIQNNEYRYISPEIAFEFEEPESKEKVGTVLLAIGLVNRPFLQGMAPVELLEQGNAIYTATVALKETAASAEKPTRRGGEKTMNEKRIRELLGLADDVDITPEHQYQAFEKLDEQLSAATVENSELRDSARGSVSLSETEIVQLKADAKLGAEARETLKLRDSENTVRDAIVSRRVLPAQEAWAVGYALRDPDGFEKFLEASPEMDPALFLEVGSGSSSEGDGGKEVQLFIDGEVSEGKAIGEAQQAALVKFGSVAFQDYRTGGKADARA